VEIISGPIYPNTTNTEGSAQSKSQSSKLIVLKENGIPIP